MMRWFLLCLTALPLLAQTAEEHADRAAALVQTHDLRGAEAELRKAVALRPDDPALLTSLGGVLGMEGDLRGANSWLTRAVQLDGQNPLLRRNLAANQWQLGELREAKENLERLLHSNPGEPVATFLLGMVSEGLHDYPRCIALLESIPDIAARKPEAAIALADAYYHTGQPDKARATIQPLANSRLALQAGRVALEAHDNRTAADLLSTANDPEGRTALALAKARLEIERGSLVQALNTANEGVRGAPDSPELQMTKATLESALHYYIDAIASWKRALVLRPHLAEARRGLATAEWQGGDRAAAVADFDRGLKEFPNDAAMRADYGTFLLDTGIAADAERGAELLRRAIALDGSLADAHYRLGNAELASGHLQEARQQLEAAAKLDPQSARAHFALSRLYRRTGQTADAEREAALWQRLKASEQAMSGSRPALGIAGQ